LKPSKLSNPPCFELYPSANLVSMIFMCHAFQSKRSRAHCVHHNFLKANFPVPNSQPTKFVSISNHSFPKVASKFILKRQFKSKFISPPLLAEILIMMLHFSTRSSSQALFSYFFCRFIKNFPFAKMSNLNLQQHDPLSSFLRLAHSNVE
jgi:hypothetical protein